MLVLTTFGSELRYSCTPEDCFICCRVLEDIPVTMDEIRRVEALGYSGFYEARSGRYFLRKPCRFLQGKWCRLHAEHGLSSKFTSCRRYPFSVSLLDNGTAIVDVKWTCRGVSLKQGERVTRELMEREFLGEVREDEQIPRGEEVYLHYRSGQMCTWNALVELYTGIAEMLPQRLHASALMLVGILRRLGASLGGGRVGVEQVRAELERLRLAGQEELLSEASSAGEVQVDLLGIYDIFGELFGYRLSPGYAARRLEIAEDVEFTENFSEIYSKPVDEEAERLLSFHLRQSFLETLARPWDVVQSCFWTLGVACFTEYIARALADSRVEEEHARNALAIADYLNKHFSSFRSHAFPKYPELGMHYVHFLASGLRT
ncbi:MAG: hypothetical protein GXN98_00990 [Euryarchaeota archaeon]|nr:hypothetical protein [Euryarchaeota archaeon]